MVELRPIPLCGLYILAVNIFASVSAAMAGDIRAITLTAARAFDLSCPAAFAGGLPRCIDDALSMRRPSLDQPRHQPPEQAD